MTQQIKLYFNAEKVCLGGVANDWWIANYQGDYWASEFFWLPEGFDPVGKHADELMQYDKPEPEQEGSNQPQETKPIEVPDEVLEGLIAVLKAGTTNMLDVAVVMAQAVALGYTDTADWIQYNKSDYFEGVFRRFVGPSSTDTEIEG
ncbi:DUF5049 domain-containing protein [Laspinema sp. A4]|uniref:DUF5049 domain-containing protein n=1 Tax=Laspinema sp. D2d TaxID=2953686 RepID=UPI0021BA57DD|nr:DUF5049 domain-containing protein [Laspinema sp. D2d]MCT7986452.1 DUF5049 domain-containing protein [Laspinema sp. D2d]